MYASCRIAMKSIKLKYFPNGTQPILSDQMNKSFLHGIPVTERHSTVFQVVRDKGSKVRRHPLFLQLIHICAFRAVWIVSG